MTPHLRAAVAVGAPVLVAGVLASAPAAGDAVPTSVVSFAYTGAPEQFVVPSGVTSLHVLAVGAPGGPAAFGSQSPGAGGSVGADLPVAPGDTLVVRVGGPGGAASGVTGGAGGFNGGGAGGTGGGAADNNGGGGGGGGASDVRSAAGDLAARLIVAPGGGGAGSKGNGSFLGGLGGDGDAAGTTGGGATPGGGGGAGTATAGGAGGSSGGGCGATGTAGAAGVGGAGGTAVSFAAAGGGGGGGYFGGGGGGAASCGAGGGGGGGGSSFVDPAATPTLIGTDLAAVPRVTLSFATPAPEPTPTPSPTPTPAAPSPQDVTAPAVALAGVPRRVGLRTFLRGLSLTATANEAVRVEGALVVTPRRARIARDELLLALARSPLGAGPHRLTFKPKRRLLGRPRKPFRAAVIVRAFDAAGNDASVRASLTVRPPRRSAIR